MSELGVHQTHCCIAHGCKYADDDCPVVMGFIDQKYPCEECGDIEVEDIKALMQLGLKKCRECGNYYKESERNPHGL